MQLSTNTTENTPFTTDKDGCATSCSLCASTHVVTSTPRNPDAAELPLCLECLEETDATCGGCPHTSQAVTECDL